MDLVQAVTELNKRIDQSNSERVREEALYEQYVSKLAALGLTPDTVDKEIETLTARKLALESEIKAEMEHANEILKQQMEKR